MQAERPQKFLFNRDFSPHAADNPALKKAAKDEQAAEAAGVDTAEKEEVTPEVVVPTFSEAEVTKARDAGYKDGHGAATKELTTSQEQRLNNTLSVISTKFDELAQAFDQDQENRSRDAVAVAVVIVRKLFPALNMDKAMDEIEHMIKEAINRTSGTPSFIIHVPEAYRDEVEAKAHELAAQRGRDDTITVVADASLADGDATIDWDGGGMIRDTKLVWQEIDEIIERNLGTELLNKHKNDAEEAARVAREASSTHPQQDTPQVEPTQEVVNDAPVVDNTKSASESPSTLPQPEDNSEDIDATATQQGNGSQDLKNDGITADDREPHPVEEGKIDASALPGHIDDAAGNADKDVSADETANVSDVLTDNKINNAD